MGLPDKWTELSLRTYFEQLSDKMNTFEMKNMKLEDKIES